MNHSVMRPYIPSLNKHYCHKEINMRFIHTADQHLFAPLKTARFSDKQQHKQRVYEFRDTFYRLLEYAKTKDIDLLFLAGDLFDHSIINIEEVRRMFERLSALSAEVFLLIGNHDTFLHQTAYQHLLKTYDIHTFSKDAPAVHLKDVSVYGINTADFNQAHLNHVASNIDTSKSNVLLLHGDVMNSEDDYYLCTVEALKRLDFDYIALGHIHKHQFLADHIAYAGNLEPLDFSETNQKGFIEGTLKKQACQADFIPFNKRSYKIKSLTIHDAMRLDDIAHDIKALFREQDRFQHFIRVILKGKRHESLTLDLKALKAALSDDFYYLDIKDETRSTLNLDRLKKDYKDTVIETIITMYESKKSKNDADEKALYIALSTLLYGKEGVQ